MKKAYIILAALVLALPLFAQKQQAANDKDLATTIWMMREMFPEGFTLDINSMQLPKEGLMVSYQATQAHFDRASIPAVIKHARAHDNIVGGWRDPDTTSTAPAVSRRTASPRRWHSPAKTASTPSMTPSATSTSSPTTSSRTSASSTTATWAPRPTTFSP